MRAIRGKDTNPEWLVRRLLFSRGFRYRLHVRALPGVPDMVLPKYRVAVFVHGCFWHGHDCYLFKLPRTRSEFWVQKIEDTRLRDGRSEEALLKEGWRVLSVWECALKGRLRMQSEVLADEIVNWILMDDPKVPHKVFRHA